MCIEMVAEKISNEECVTSEDRELMCRLAKQLAAGPGNGEKPQLIRDINRMILQYDERQLRFVYFFAKGIS